MKQFLSGVINYGIRIENWQASLIETIHGVDCLLMIEMLVKHLRQEPCILHLRREKQQCLLHCTHCKGQLVAWTSLESLIDLGCHGCSHAKGKELEQLVVECKLFLVKDLVCWESVH